MSRFFILVSLFVAYPAFGEATAIVPSYSICEQSDYDLIGDTEEYLDGEFNRAVADSSGSQYVKFWLRREEKFYWVKRPIAQAQHSRQQVGQRTYLLCLTVASE